MSRPERDQFSDLSIMVTQGTMAAALRQRMGRFSRSATEELISTIQKGGDLTTREIGEFFWHLDYQPTLQLSEVEPETPIASQGEEQ